LDRVSQRERVSQTGTTQSESEQKDRETAPRGGEGMGGRLAGTFHTQEDSPCSCNFDIRPLLRSPARTWSNATQKPSEEAQKTAKGAVEAVKSKAQRKRVGVSE
jgi:hypothetical protein